MSENSGGIDGNEERGRHNERAESERYSSVFITNDPSRINAHTAAQHSNKPNWVEKWTLVILFVTFIAACYAGYEANWLAVSTSKILSATLRDENPYVALQDITFVSNERVGAPAWLLTTNWRNSGRSPTSDMSMKINFIVSPFELPQNFANCSNQIFSPRISLGAQSSDRIVIAPIDDNVVQSFDKATLEKIVVWGTTIFFDGEGARHETRFCWNADSLRPIAGNLDMIHSLCANTVGNCTDDECKDDDTKLPRLGTCVIAQTDGGITFTYPAERDR